MIGLRTASEYAAASRGHGWVPWRPVADIEPALFFGESQSNQDGNGETEVGSKLSLSSLGRSLTIRSCGQTKKSLWFSLCQTSPNRRVSFGRRGPASTFVPCTLYYTTGRHQLEHRQRGHACRQVYVPGTKCRLLLGAHNNNKPHLGLSCRTVPAPTRMAS